MQTEKRLPRRHHIADAVSKFDDAACPLGFEPQRVEFYCQDDC